MVRTIREHEEAERLDEQGREREQQAYRQRKAREDEDTLHDLPVEQLGIEPEEPQQDDDLDHLKCERVQDRGPGRDCEEE